MRSRVLLLALIACFAHSASADVLWDQSNVDDFGPGYFNSISGSPPFGSTNYTVNDVTVPSPGWVVNSITIWFSATDPNWGLGITQGSLHIWPKTGPLPTEDPGTSPTVPMSAVLDTNTNRFVVTASGLNETLAPGDYWIGITPVAPSGGFGPEIHLASLTLIGDESASYDAFGFPAPMWMGFNAGVDASILVEGVLSPPVPVEKVTWGQIKLGK